MCFYLVWDQRCQMCFHNTLPQDSGSRDTKEGKGGKNGKNAKGKSKGIGHDFQKNICDLWWMKCSLRVTCCLGRCCNLPWCFLIFLVQEKIKMLKETRLAVASVTRIYVDFRSASVVDWRYLRWWQHEIGGWSILHGDCDWRYSTQGEQNTTPI